MAGKKIGPLIMWHIKGLMSNFGGKLYSKQGSQTDASSQSACGVMPIFALFVIAEVTTKFGHER